MSLPDELLDLAGKLGAGTAPPATQGELRRAVSTAYYALLHLLIDGWATQFTENAELGRLLGRTFVHTEMWNVAASVAGSGTLPAYWLQLRPTGTDGLPEIVEVARAFMTLQTARHEADYERTKTWAAADVVAKVQVARQAFAAWRKVSADPAQAEARELFLASLLWGERLKRVK